MVQFCCVTGCGNRSNREQKQFYRLPNISKTCDRASYKADIVLRRRKQWLLNIGRADLKDGDEAYSPGYIRVCSDHFVSGKPSVWSDVDNIDWAPTFEMGSGNDLSSSQRKRPHKNTTQKRAIRVQELHTKRMLLGLTADVKQRKVTEQKGEGNKAEYRASQTQAVKIIKGAPSNLLNGAKKRGVTQQRGKKNAAKGKTTKNRELKVKRQTPKVSGGSKQSGAARKKVKAPEKRAAPHYSAEIVRMLRKQELKVRRKILELELTGGTQSTPAEKFTVNPIIHRITMDCIALSPQDDAEFNKEGASTDSNIGDSGNTPEIKVEGAPEIKEEVLEGTHEIKEEVLEAANEMDVKEESSVN